MEPPDVGLSHQVFNHIPLLYGSDVHAQPPSIAGHELVASTKVEGDKYQTLRRNLQED